ncbi:hypothetical protein [Deinococcus radiophilus]|uniref:Uncharacterized protein n=1 Tax=Deinococcus radiophilus TaxID=32062 RepID=A0A3S0K9M9_9DEIO|nr:hypothetical protein [Deinococcus radiophilus]RTR25744.1 hypothetical protein EJ104_09950 [Deinococcus radiophilus]UFA50183.1 hypothetical protein LMT64_09940 [Deinococcus radiophilus]
MLKVGSYVLGALLLFALVFALMPASSPRTATGATLNDVSLTLYPANDPEAHWTFQADQVVNDPLSGETHLSTLKEGGRWVNGLDASGLPTGEKVLDARLAADDLTIDSQDNMTTREATITLIEQCADIHLSGNDAQPVVVQQNVGFSAPLAEVDAPGFKSEIPDLAMTFDFTITGGSADSQTGWDMNATEQCVDGQIVPISSAQNLGATHHFS